MKRDQRGHLVLHAPVGPGLRHLGRGQRLLLVVPAVDLEEEAGVRVERADADLCRRELAAVRLGGATLAEIKGDVAASRVALLDLLVEDAGERADHALAALDDPLGPGRSLGRARELDEDVAAFPHHTAPAPVADPT